MIIWTEEDIAYLVDHYARTPMKVISQHLHRSVTGVRIKAHSLNLKKDPEYLREIRIQARETHKAKLAAQKALVPEDPRMKMQARLEEIDMKLNTRLTTSEMEQLVRERSSIMYKLDRSVAEGVASVSTTQWAS